MLRFGKVHDVLLNSYHQACTDRSDRYREMTDEELRLANAAENALLDKVDEIEIERINERRGWFR